MSARGRTHTQFRRSETEFTKKRDEYAAAIESERADMAREEAQLKDAEAKLEEVNAVRARRRPRGAALYCARLRFFVRARASLADGAYAGVRSKFRGTRTRGTRARRSRR